MFNRDVNRKIEEAVQEQVKADKIFYENFINTLKTEHVQNIININKKHSAKMEEQDNFWQKELQKVEADSIIKYEKRISKQNKEIEELKKTVKENKITIKKYDKAYRTYEAMRMHLLRITDKTSIASEVLQQLTSEIFKQFETLKFEMEYHNRQMDKLRDKVENAMNMDEETMEEAVNN